MQRFIQIILASLVLLSNEYAIFLFQLSADGGIDGRLDNSLRLSFSTSYRSSMAHAWTFGILGGTGKIGTAVAAHLIHRQGSNETSIVLIGRRSKDDPQTIKSIKELEACCSAQTKASIRYQRVDDVWTVSSVNDCTVDDAVDNAALRNFIKNECDCLIHTAGPYMDQSPTLLELAIQSSRCKAYVDVSDPLPFLDSSLAFNDQAKQTKTTALIAAGAFPGMSNVLALEAASHLSDPNSVHDIQFNYFTAGLGGSGVVNLYITNLGFGEPMAVYDGGKLQYFSTLPGSLLGRVNFEIETASFDQLNNHNDEDNTTVSPPHQGINTLFANPRVGKQQVFAWPFPEAATVGRMLQVTGNTYAAMGTAPDIWNNMLGFLVDIIPRPWWKSKSFCKFMADFSQPLVWLSDQYLKFVGIGETHCMRIDVTSSGGDTPGAIREGVSIVQGHDSFRNCVGQSCAEFALDILEHPDAPGVYLPEQRYYQDTSARARIIETLTATPGTFAYSGPIKLVDPTNVKPTKYETALQNLQ